MREIWYALPNVGVGGGCVMYELVQLGLFTQASSVWYLTQKT